MTDPELPRWYVESQAPWGARWVRCALQVNPYEYLVRHRKPVVENETDYNAQLVAALVAADVELIAITDHYRVRGSVGLAEAARAEGITALLGFEASTSEGVHLLCIFDEGCDVETIDRRIGLLGIEPGVDPSPIGTLDTVALLAKCHEWKAACIAAHATYDSGLLKHLAGQSRIKAWTSPYLYAAAIAGSPDALPSPYREIVANQDHAHERERPVAILNAGDISSPDDLERPGATCRLKLSQLSLDALRQSFLDPELRVRLDADADDQVRPTVRAVHWEGGFLSGQTVQLADELSVLVGAPGAGKSTVIESLRAALELAPESPRAQADHSAIVQQVLGSQTTISVVVHYPTPTPTTYVVERTLPNPSRVLKADTWQPSGLAVGDLQPALQIYGQHEVAELAEDAERRTTLLERFVTLRPERDERMEELQTEIHRLRETIIAETSRVDALNAELSLLPGQEEKLARYEEAGVAEKLELQTQLDRELRVIKAAREELADLGNAVDAFAGELPLEVVAKGNAEVAESPFLDVLVRLDGAIADVSAIAEAAIEHVRNGLTTSSERVEAVFAAWKDRRAEADEELRATKDQLQDKDIDHETYRALRARVDELKALKPKLDRHVGALQAARNARVPLLAEHERLAAEAVRDYQSAASRVSGQLVGMVRVTTTSAPNHDEVDGLLRRQGGRLAEILQLLRDDGAFSPRDLAERVRNGTNALKARWTLSDAQAERLAQTEDATTLELEELEPALLTRVELNVSTGTAEPRWQALEELSKGQKATAILLFLLLDSEAPLVVDQPEDDLDNRFIADRIVPAVRRKKAARQFVFSTHNPNVPVLADAELIVGLTATADVGGRGRAEVLEGHRGSIDAPTVKHLIEERLEGGRAAFLERQRKYGLE